jgi:hypothetical protein
MKVVSQHAVIGAVVAAILTVGATSGSGEGQFGRFSPLANGPAGWFAGTIEICADAVLDRALDTYGALIGRLRQI